MDFLERCLNDFQVLAISGQERPKTAPGASQITPRRFKRARGGPSGVDQQQGAPRARNPPGEGETVVFEECTFPERSRIRARTRAGVRRRRGTPCASGGGRRSLPPRNSTDAPHEPDRIELRCLRQDDHAGEPVGGQWKPKKDMQAMSSANINVLMITQASSEHSICVAVPHDQGEKALAALKAQI